MAEIVYSLNRFPQITAAMHKSIAKIVRETAADGTANVQAWISANGQVDTGFMMASVYTSTSRGSTYDKGGHIDMTPYQALQRDLLPEIEPPEDDLTAYFAVAASYAEFQNYGTRYLPPRPFWEPGVEETRQMFEDDLSSLEAVIEAGL